MVFFFYFPDTVPDAWGFSPVRTALTFWGKRSRRLFFGPPAFRFFRHQSFI